MSGIPAAALWHGPPSRDRQRELEEDYFFDHDNEWAGGFGVMYHRKRRGSPWVIFTGFVKPVNP